MFRIAITAWATGTTGADVLVDAQNLLEPIRYFDLFLGVLPSLPGLVCNSLCATKEGLRRRRDGVLCRIE